MAEPIALRKPDPRFECPICHTIYPDTQRAQAERCAAAAGIPFPSDLTPGKTVRFQIPGPNEGSSTQHTQEPASAEGVVEMLFYAPPGPGEAAHRRLVQVRLPNGYRLRLQPEDLSPA